MGIERRRPGLCPRFFVDGAQAEGGEIELDGEDSHHAAHVLRLRPGDPCEVASSAGKVFEAVVLPGGEPVRVKLGEERVGEAAGALYRTEVGLVQALARPSALDFTVEKGTEVGASFFLLVEAAGSPRTGGKGAAERLTRWRRIAREAAKQSKQAAVPKVDIFPTVGAAVSGLGEAGTASIVLEPGASESLDAVMAAVDRPRVALWVGPEGGWTQEELDALSESGALRARLGRGVLRTETAGPVAVAVARLAWGDW